MEEIQSTTTAVYDFLCAYIAEHGYPPSQRELAAGCYLSRPAIIRHLDRLELQGKITRDPDKARSIRLQSGD